MTEETDSEIELVAMLSPSQTEASSIMRPRSTFANVSVPPRRWVASQAKHFLSVMGPLVLSRRQDHLVDAVSRRLVMRIRGFAMSSLASRFGTDGELADVVHACCHAVAQCVEDRGAAALEEALAELDAIERELESASDRLE